MSDNSNHNNKKDISGEINKLTSSELFNKLATQNASFNKLNPTNSITEIARQQNAIREKLNPVSSVLKGFATTTALSKLAQQQNAFKEKLNPLFSFQDTIRGLYKTPLNEISGNSALSIIMGGSTVSVLAKLTHENSHKFNTTASALDLITSNPHLFSKQVSIFEKLNRHFYEINKLGTPQWLEQMNSVKDYSKVKTLSAFEILSANTLSQFIGEYPDEEVLTDTEEGLDKMSSLIEENEELKLEIEKLLKKIANPPKSKSLEKQLAELEDPIKQFSYFVHLNLFRGTEKWSLKTTYYFISLINYLIVGIYLTKRLENLFFTDTAPTQTVINHNHVAIDNRRTVNVYMFDNTSEWGVITKNAKVYRRKSTKTDCIGTVLGETTVRILKMKGGWIFIESAMSKFDKKTKMDIDFVSRGWVKQDVVAFEQN